MPNSLLVAYHSKKGSTQRMAEEIAKGAKDAGANVIIKGIAGCSMADLLSTDALAFGSPTYYGNMA